MNDLDFSGKNLELYYRKNDVASHLMMNIIQKFLKYFFKY